VALPNFLVIGAGRSGTTSLDRYLRRHPDVFLPPVKAPSYFYCLANVERGASRSSLPPTFVADRERYVALFEEAGACRARGEVSPVYLAMRRVAATLASEIPDVRLVAVIRDPIARLKARYVGRRRDGLERRSVDEILREERTMGLPADDARGTYVAAGFVGHVLHAYYERFPADRIHVIRSEDLAGDPVGTMAGIFRFIGVDPSTPIELDDRHNASGGIIRGRMRRVVWTRTAPARAALGPSVPRGLRDRAFRAFTRDLAPVRLDDEIVAELIELYRDDVALQQRLTGLDLSGWLRAGHA
jgi:Sulfotransferase family